VADSCLNQLVAAYPSLEEATQVLLAAMQASASAAAPPGSLSDDLTTRCKR
jgi:hypothetical protein